MKTLVIFFSLVICFHITVIPQSNAEIKKQKEVSRDTLKKKISGVRFADLRFTKAQEQLFLSNASSPDAQLLLGIVNYLKKDLGLLVIVTQEQRIEALKNAKSRCDLVFFDYDIGQFKSSFAAIGTIPFSFSFSFCDKSKYTFTTKLNVSGLTILSNKTRATCYSEFACTRKFDINKKMSVQKNPSLISLTDFTKYLDTSLTKLPIEGIFQLFSSSNNTSKYKLGICNMKDTLKIIYFDGADFSEDWAEGELKGYLTKTNSDSHFFAKWNNLDKSTIDAALTLINPNSFELKSSDIYTPMDDKYVRLK
jgi:hypothetical protein